ncbi:sugar kinase [Pseudodesulfovibrio sp. JC047]|uniref:NAD(P)H-hydrate dehydratase n=1 Tax=Pseudodesulfovibrio sp. JC047 TaxID=2683199 RepID=UPI0013D754E6|nr:NAD(P)H-hydrate dehydratase [Pseudodesulfovibrio sp. JC047]NDV18305.1 sugar kinase [Pseudodesulfovibrio sp. JC047]
MLAIVGTVPDLDVPVLDAPVVVDGADLVVDGRMISPDRGTAALLAAAVETARLLNEPMPHVFLVGDQGVGDGSRALYAHLATVLPKRQYSTMVFHYLQPDVDWHNKVLLAIQEMEHPPRLIADAGFMYAAKMSGQAPAYDLFTPDAGELAFLADETAPHPFYTRGFILHDDNHTPDLIARAYAHENAAEMLLVKGTVDYVADRDGIRYSVAEPVSEPMEAMGGTGDTVTGMVAALIESGLSVDVAAHYAIKANRLSGFLAQPSPATRVGALIPFLAEAMRLAGVHVAEI